MSLTAEWLLPDRIVCVRVSGTVTTDEIDQLATDLIALEGPRDPSRAIHLLIDMSAAEDVPLRLQRIYGAAKRFLDGIGGHRGGYFIVFGSRETIVSQLLNTVAAMFKVQHRHCATQADALEFLTRVDPSLAPALTGRTR